MFPLNSPTDSIFSQAGIITLSTSIIKGGVEKFAMKQPIFLVCRHLFLQIISVDHQLNTFGNNSRRLSTPCILPKRVILLLFDSLIVWYTMSCSSCLRASAWITVRGFIYKWFSRSHPNSYRWRWKTVQYGCVSLGLTIPVQISDHIDCRIQVLWHISKQLWMLSLIWTRYECMLVPTRPITDLFFCSLFT